MQFIEKNKGWANFMSVMENNFDCAGNIEFKHK